MTTPNDIKQISAFCSKLKKTTSTNEKKAIIEEYKDSSEIRAFLYFMFNPNVTTGISAKKLHKVITYTGTFPTFIDVCDMMSYLMMHSSGRDIDILAVQEFVLGYGDDFFFTNEEEELVEGIATKSIKLGIDKKSINEVIPGLIPKFEVQLAESYSKYSDRVDDKEFAVTEKIDGCRCIAVMKNGSISLYTRSGKLYTGLVEIEDALLSTGLNDFVLDGEIVIKGYHKMDSGEAFNITRALLSTDNCYKAGLVYRVFDMPGGSTDFETQSVLDRGYIQRYADADKICSMVTRQVDCIEHLPIWYIGKDINMIDVCAKDIVSKGGEGVMVNIIDAPYQYKRTPDMLKVKYMQDAEFKIIGYAPGEGKYKGTLGALVVEIEHDGQTNAVFVGSGFKDDERDEIYADIEHYIGKMCVVKFFEYTKDEETGLPSLRFPVYKGMRDAWDIGKDKD